jgi:peptide/nickel transport system substrate-binding protein
MAPIISFLNMRIKPFDDVRARRAVGGFGLDRAEIAKVAFHGRTKPLVSVLAPGVPDAIDLNELYPYKPDEAKKLLEELGYDQKNPLKFTILVGNHDTTLADIAALIKNQMTKIGVDAKINLMDSTAVVDRVLVKHDFEMVVSNWANLIDINMRSVSFFKGQQSDYMGIDDPKLEDLVHQWRRALEPEKRKAISADIQRLLADHSTGSMPPGIPIFRHAPTRSRTIHSTIEPICSWKQPGSTSESNSGDTSWQIMSVHKRIVRSCATASSIWSGCRPSLNGV